MDILSTNNNSVKLKGIGKSLWLTVDLTTSEFNLKVAVDRIFKNKDNISGKSRIVIDYDENEKVSTDIIERLGSYLINSYGVAVTIMHPHRIDTQNVEYLSAKREVKIFSGKLRSGQNVSTDSHLVFYGDVNPGAKLSAGGDIVVVGNLKGTALAGQPSNEDAIIIALAFRPLQVQIGCCVAAGPPSSPSDKAEYAYVQNDEIVVEEYLKANPFGDINSLEMR
ncbi:MAG: septum site-determining protein MinC [Desulfobacterales bacterium]|nr:septum site-determining protein MinC [Desulfobacterales bacterium]MCP4159536.1 septum site-determining protein MinC [Deltaproteobacteria bacterium]